MKNLMEKMKVNKKKIFGILALVIVVYGVYTFGIYKGEEAVEDKESVTAESAATTEEGSGQVDVEPSPEQIEQSEEESDEYDSGSDETATQKYFSLMRNVFIKYEDRLGSLIEMHSAGDNKITVSTDRGDYVIDLVESDGYAYITNMDTAEKTRYPLPE